MNKKRLIPLMLSLSMIASSLPVFADEVQNNEAEMLVAPPTTETVGEKMVMYSDDFSNGSDNWKINSKNDVYVLNKRLVFNRAKTTSKNVTAFADGMLIDNGEFGFDLMIENGSYFETYFRMKDENSYYTIRIYPNGKMMLFKKIGGGQDQLIKTGISSLKSDKNSRIEITLKGSNIEVKCDGEKVLFASDFSIKSGKIGFGGNDTRSYVDNVEIYKYDNVTYEIVEVDTSIKQAKQMYIATNGDDINGDGSYEKPYQTIKKAKEEATYMKVGNTPVDVIFKAGEYRITEPINFTSDDSGKENALVRYKGEDGKKVVLTAGRKLDVSKFKPVEGEVKDRLKDDVKDKVMQLDLRSQGIVESDVNFASYTFSGQCRKPPQIVLNGAKQSIARWPNTDYLRIGDVDNGGKYDKATLYYSTSEPLRWTKAKDMFVEGWFGNDWHGEWIKVNEVDIKKSALQLDTCSVYGVTTGHRWAAINLLEEIDIPGEWYIDADNLILYYYPPYKLTNADDLEISGFKQNLITFTGASYINLENLEITMNSDDFGINNMTDNGGNGISILGNSKYITIKDCNIVNTGMNGVNINSGSNNITIDGCIIRNAGYNCVYVGECGVRSSITPSDIVISNCDISDSCRDSHQNAWGGIVLANNSVGVTIKNNVLHNHINNAIRYDGLGHNIAYNEIYSAVTSTADAGAIYGGRSWASYGTSINHNFFHDIGQIFRTQEGGYLCCSVFWDDMFSGQDMSYNISVNNNYTKSTGLQLGGGVDNTVIGNTIANTEKGFQLDDRSTSKNQDWTAYANTTLRYSTVPTSNLNKYPLMATVVKRVQENNNVVKLENIVTDNLSVNNSAPNKMATQQINDSVIERNVELGNEDIFVDAANLDYRVKKSAKAKFGISDKILDEDFNIDSIGIQNGYKVDQSQIETKAVYPENNATGISIRKGQLAWTRAALADNYTYAVATDPEFNNVVVEGTTIELSVPLENKLKKNTKYYWKVTSNYGSRQNRISIPATNGIKNFTTAEFEELETEGIEQAINNAKDVLATIREGSSVGQYKRGTIASVQEQITKAEEAMKNLSLEQSDIDELTQQLNKLSNGIDSNINPGYTTLKLTADSSWRTNNVATTVTAKEGSATINVSGGTEITLAEIIPNYNIMCFRTKVDNFDNNAWFAYGLRAQTEASAIYAQDAYYILMKEDIFELQKHGVIYMTAENNGKFKAGEWNDIKFGSITTTNGINMIFELNGELIFDYLDKNEPQYKPGMFAIFAQSSDNKIEIESAKTVPQGVYEFSDEIKAAINKQAADGDTYGTDHADYIETGVQWSSVERVWGDGGSTIRRTTNKDNTAKWIMNTGKAGNDKLYKVYYYHIPSANGDKNVRVELSGYAGTYETTIDLSQGEEGYVELGTFRFANEGYVGTLAVTFIASGEGEMQVSNVKFERDDNGKDMLK